MARPRPGPSVTCPIVLLAALAASTSAATPPASETTTASPPPVTWTPRAPLPAALSDFSATRMVARATSPYAGGGGNTSTTTTGNSSSSSDSPHYLIAIVGGCDAPQSLVCADEAAQTGCFFACPHATAGVALYDPAGDRYFHSALDEGAGAPAAGAESGSAGANGTALPAVDAAPVARLRHAAAALFGGELLVVLGGRTADTDELITAVDVFNASSGACARSVSERAYHYVHALTVPSTDASA